MLLYVGSWIPIGIVLTQLIAHDKTLSYGEAALIAIPMCLVYAFLCQASWYLCRAVPLQHTETVRLCVTHATAAAVSAGVWIGIGYIWVWLIETSAYFGPFIDRYVGQLPILVFSGVVLFLLAVALNYLLITFEGSQQAEKKALQLDVLAREAELKALRAQVDPHFLFNSLNSINAMIMTDAAAARRMCVLLAEFLRGSLKLGSELRIPLADELRLTECYLDIERVRLGSRLRVEKDVERECEMCMVPPLILQPLVENAITHGVAPMLDGGVVRLQVERNGAGVRIAIENAFEPESASKNGAGMGLQNVRMRLKNLYNGDARMNVDENGDRFRVELQLPCDH
jgi:two-component system sensor histidine kinase AlgZ